MALVEQSLVSREIDGYLIGIEPSSSDINIARRRHLSIDALPWTKGHSDGYARNHLKRNGYKTVGDVWDLFSRGNGISLQNYGMGAYQATRRVFSGIGIELPDPGCDTRSYKWKLHA